MDSQVTVVMVPLPAQGHLNQLLHLSYVISSFGIPVHFACSSVHNRQAKLRLHGRDPESSTKIDIHDFELPCRSPPPNPSTGSHFPTHLQPLFDEAPQLRQPVSQLVQQLSEKYRRVVVVHDNMMASVVQDVKSIPNAECYVFIPCCAFTLFFGIWDAIPVKPFELDSDVPSSCVPSHEGCFSPEVMSCVENESKYLNFQSGFLFNTCREIEGKYIDLVKMMTMSSNMKNFAIGPFHPFEMKPESKGQKRHECLEWLDKQEKDSVIYVSFGSTTVMTDEQIRELALGLEHSGHKFIWVLKNADRVNVFTEDGTSVPQLPEGYENRVKDRGMVVRTWAPQLDILAHPSTGGFMSHCGWNSCLESITMGVPIAAWPMHSDQPRNTVLITEVLKISTVVRDWANRAETTTSDVVKNSVKVLMASKEGDEMRARAFKLGESVRRSAAEGGSSHSEMESFVAHINRC
ncbi:hypothetical protein RND81_11G086000 [Saponaria officinalis]|uniref:Glycosyltransferase n=1 Tax=Saponaria officinalis TaxID=3572 RepID=A0AAW1HIL7_SAPOF